VKGAKLEIYKGAPHGLPSTHKDKLNADLLAFLEAAPSVRTSRPARRSGDASIRH
jgi:hypothetical protein